MLNLTDGHYRYGSYTRGDFRNDILYGVISFAGMEALLAPQFAVVRDSWAERHRAFLAPSLMAAYENELTAAVRAAAKDEAFFEDIMGETLALRRRIFAADADGAFIRDAETPWEALKRADIDQTDRLEGLMAQGGSVLFLLQDGRYMNLMRSDIQRARERGLRLYAAVSGTERGPFPSQALLRRLLPDADVQPLSCEGPLCALNGDEPLARDAAGGRAFIVYYGERGLTDCRNLAVPAFIRCAPESLTGRAVAGQFMKTGRCDVFVPAHFDILPKVPLRKRTIASYRQYAWLSHKAGEKCYGMACDELYRRWPEAFFSVYDEENMDFPCGIAWPQTQERDGWYADFCARRDAALGNALENIPGVKRLSGWFALDTGEEKPVPWTAQGEAKGILVHGVLIEKAVEAQVVISENEAISPRRLAAEQRQEGWELILNYLFFLTPRLAALYNHLREGRPREQTALRGGHLDYMLTLQDGRREETFPLYRKACMAMLKDGSFRFFHFRLGGGACTVNGQPLRWEADCVDAQKPGKIAVYTPYASRGDEGASKFTYTKAVGEGRINLVILQDQIACVRDGDVLLPCMGAVLSLEKEWGARFLSACGLKPAGGGYYSWERAPKLTVTLDPPEGFSPEEWGSVQWAYGGGLTLIHNGENLFSDDASAAAHLDREGWASPLSSQTQESDVASMVRHPRTAIGLTWQGKLFALVFSGRSSVTAGADYREMCLLAQRLVPDVKEMMNVDGGGSSVLGMVTNGRLIEYSWPSTTPGTPAGMARPIHSLFKIQL